MPAPSTALGFYPQLDGSVTEADLLAFLAEQVAENRVVEYKEASEARKAVPTVAGFANTHGGYLIIGVPEEKRNGRTVPSTSPTPLAAHAGSAFRSSCFDQLDPPWVPEVVEVPIGADGKVVLVVRVPAMRQLRPIVCGGVVYVRYDDQTRSAPREEIRRLFAETDTAEPTFLPHPDGFVGHTGFGTTLTGDWLIVRGVATAALTPGMALRALDDKLRPAIAETVRAGPVETWLADIADGWRCNVNPLAISGETNSIQYGLERMAVLPYGGEGAVHVRVLVGASSPPNRNSGFWCVVDVAASSANAKNDDYYHDHDKARLQGMAPNPIALTTLVDRIAVALTQAEITLKCVVDAHDEPRPRDVFYAAGLVGNLAHNINFASVGTFTKDINQSLQHALALVEPRARAEFDELDSDAIAQAYIDRLILDMGHVTPP